MCPSHTVLMSQETGCDMGIYSTSQASIPQRAGRGRRRRQGRADRTGPRRHKHSSAARCTLPAGSGPNITIADGTSSGSGGPGTRGGTVAGAVPSDPTDRGPPPSPHPTPPSCQFQPARQSPPTSTRVDPLPRGCAKGERKKRLHQ